MNTKEQSRLKHLIIVESPNKVGKIGEILRALEKSGKIPRGDYIVDASYGHIRDLPMREGSISRPGYALHYELSDKGRKIIQRLKAKVAEADEVSLSTDPDREGEAISWHLKAVLGLTTYQRVTFNEITEAAILAAMTAPRKINDQLVRAQEARRALDWLVGYRVSPALSNHTGKPLSAGRVQSVAVRLVVEREREIVAFQETKHFGASLSFDSGAWQAEWVTKPHLAEGREYILDKTLAERAASCRQFTVTACETRPERKAPPAPFTTSSLLQAASVALKLKPEATMDAAQELFAAGHITYHRTDSQNLSGEAIELIRTLASKNRWELPEQSRRWPSKDGAQEAHEAIRPTHFDVETAGDDDAQRGLYRLIWQRAVACQLADAEYSTATIELDAETHGTTFKFRARGSVPTKQGWKALTAKDAAEEDEGEGTDGDGGKVPALAVGSGKTADSGKVLAKKTRPPTRYTEASLIKKMEALGIGRPSTYANIMKRIGPEKGYVTEQKRFLVPTEAGVSVVDGLCGRFVFAEYPFTREVEESLDNIACGKATYLDVVRTFDEALSGELTALGASGVKHPCPECGRTLLRREGKRGPFWGCSGYRDGCEVTCADDGGKPGAVNTKSATPSEKQLALAERLSEETSEAIPDEARTNPKILTEWINSQIAKKGTSPATDPQMKLIKKLVEEGNKPPPGWPDSVSIRDAKEFLDREIKKSSGERKARPANRKKGSTR